MVRSRKRGRLAGGQTNDASEAEAIIENDPAVMDGIFVAKAHPWYMVEWERFDASARGTGTPEAD